VAAGLATQRLLELAARNRNGGAGLHELKIAHRDISAPPRRLDRAHAAEVCARL
jgi:hypothetical protein